MYKILFYGINHPAPIFRDASLEDSKMRKGLILAVLAVFVFAPTIASAQGGRKSTSGYCKSGIQVGNVKNCKENGGTK